MVQKVINKPKYKECPPAAKYNNEKHWVKFNYIEQPGQTVDFTFGKTVWNKSTGYIGTEHENYHMIDGKIYELPKYIIDHLNSLTVPDPRMEKMPNGEIRVSTDRVRNRFGCSMANEPREADKVDARVKR